MEFDLAVVNGRLIDGTGSPWRWADVAVREERICFVGRRGDVNARRTIDAAGMVVCPGFIDVHTHSDLAPLVDPRQSAKVMQGVTTEVIGQDGLSYAPLTDRTVEYFRANLKSLNGEGAGLDWDWRSTAQYLGRFDRGVATNIAFLAPHGNIRAAVVGLENRAPTTGELEEMKRLLARSMHEGAFGLSTALTYAPCSFAETEELVELCRVVGARGGYFAPHMRNYGADMPAAVEEVIEVATAARVPLHLTHFHASFAPNKGKAGEYLRRIDRARRDGLEVTADIYPYLAGSTFMAGLLPGWAQEGDPRQVIGRLTDPETRRKIRREMEVTGSDGLQKLPAQWDAIVVSNLGSQKSAELVGLSLQEISRRKGKGPFDCYADLLIEEDLAAACLQFIGNEENLRRFMQHPAFMAGSDGLLVGQRPHPRGWGTFAKYLGTYVRELGILTLEDCVRKMTSLPAGRLGLQDRGIVSTGMAADLVVFDPDTVRDTATYENPKSYPAGIPFVVVNGQLVKDHDEQTDALPGRALKRS